MFNKIIERICMNPDCKDNIYLKNTPDERPIIRLGKVCWNCKNKDHLVEKH